MSDSRELGKNVSTFERVTEFPQRSFPPHLHYLRSRTGRSAGNRPAVTLHGPELISNIEDMICCIFDMAKSHL